MKTIALAIYSAPRPNGSACTAHNLAQALVAQGHRISRLFFLNDGVYNSVSKDVENSLPDCWSTFILTHSIDAVVCVASAEKRGIGASKQLGDKSEVQSPLPGFEIAGLAQLIDASIHSDHVLTFSD